MRDDTLSYEHDYRIIQGPVVIRYVRPEMPFAAYFDAGFCPLCCSRLSWNRTLCFDDEEENQCADCLTVWRE